MSAEWQTLYRRLSRRYGPDLASEATTQALETIAKRPEWGPHFLALTVVIARRLSWQAQHPQRNSGGKGYADALRHDCCTVTEQTPGTGIAGRQLERVIAREALAALDAKLVAFGMGEWGPRRKDLNTMRNAAGEHRPE